jgi:hypothetical protein
MLELSLVDVVAGALALVSWLLLTLEHASRKAAEVERDRLQAANLTAAEAHLLELDRTDRRHQDELNRLGNLLQGGRPEGARAEVFHENLDPEAVAAQRLMELELNAVQEKLKAENDATGHKYSLDEIQQEATRLLSTMFGNPVGQL